MNIIQWQHTKFDNLSLFCIREKMKKNVILLFYKINIEKKNQLLKQMLNYINTLRTLLYCIFIVISGLKVLMSLERRFVVFLSVIFISLRCCHLESHQEPLIVSHLVLFFMLPAQQMKNLIMLCLI